MALENIRKPLFFCFQEVAIEGDKWHEICQKKKKKKKKSNETNSRKSNIEDNCDKREIIKLQKIAINLLNITSLPFGYTT